MFVIFVTLINLKAVIYDLILATGQEARLLLASHYFSSQSRRFSILEVEPQDGDCGCDSTLQIDQQRILRADICKLYL